MDQYQQQLAAQQAAQQVAAQRATDELNLFGVDKNGKRFRVHVTPPIPKPVTPIESQPTPRSVNNIALRPHFSLGISPCSSCGGTSLYHRGNCSLDIKFCMNCGEKYHSRDYCTNCRSKCPKCKEVTGEYDYHECKKCAQRNCPAVPLRV